MKTLRLRRLSVWCFVNTFCPQDLKEYICQGLSVWLYLNLNVNKLHCIIDEIFVHYNIANIQLFP